MSAPAWISSRVVLAVHNEQLTKHGGLPGIRDPGLLESVLSRPKNIVAYGANTHDPCALAAAYAYGILRNHPFVDGNKRTAFVVMKLFLQLNGYELNINDNEFVEIMPKVAAGAIQETMLIDWLKTKTTLRVNKQVESVDSPRFSL